MDPLLVVLDLDETLVFATKTPETVGRTPDFHAGPYSVFKRPGLDRFVAELSQRCSLAVWTASSGSYASRVVSETMHHVPLEFVWASDRCTRRFDPESGEYYTLKKLSKVRKRGYPLDRVVHVDNLASCFRQNYGNGIRVRDYLGAEHDEELERLLPMLDHLAGLSDVRPVEKRAWWRRSWGALDRAT